METWEPVLSVGIETTGVELSDGAALSSGRDDASRLTVGDFIGRAWAAFGFGGGLIGRTGSKYCVFELRALRGAVAVGVGKASGDSGSLAA